MLVSLAVGQTVAFFHAFVAGCGFTIRLLLPLADHLNKHRPGLDLGRYLAGKVDANAFYSFIRFQSKSKAQSID